MHPLDFEVEKIDDIEENQWYYGSSMKNQKWYYYNRFNHIEIY